MALVSYDVSDVSDSEEEDPSNISAEIQVVRNVVEVVNDKNKEKDTDDGASEKTDVESGFCSILPTPKAKPVIFNSDLSKKLLLNKPSHSVSKKSVRIAVPSLSEFDEELPTPTIKRTVQPTKGSGLFALLPPPKNSATFAKEKRLVPDTVRRPPPPKPVSKPIAKPLPKPALAPLVEEIEEDDDEDVDENDVDFLGLKKRHEPEPVAVVPEIPIEPISFPLPQESMGIEEKMDSGSSFYPPTLETISLPREDIELNDEAMRALCGGNKRKRNNFQAQLIDVSDSDVLPDSQEWMIKQLTEEKVQRQSHKKKAGPSSQQKKKHQITYLAFQAKEQEQELQNQWAANRQTKKQTQSKYGF